MTSNDTSILYIHIFSVTISIMLLRKLPGGAQQSFHSLPGDPSWAPSVARSAAARRKADAELRNSTGLRLLHGDLAGEKVRKQSCAAYERRLAVMILAAIIMNIPGGFL